MRPAATTRPAVFLDKDGTIVEDVPYNVDPALMRLASGAVEGLRLLHAVGYALIVVTNQSGVARGMFREEALAVVERRLGELLGEAGVPLAGFYYCPHHPAGSVREYAVACSCRKPGHDLILRAAREHGIDLTRSWMVGDAPSDVEAGRGAGCRTVLLVGGATDEVSPPCDPDRVAADLERAARAITRFSAGTKD